MANFQGSVMVADDPESSVRALIEVSEERLHLWAGDSELGSWSLSEVAITSARGGFELTAEGERLLIEVDEPAAFGAAVGANSAGAAPAPEAAPRVQEPVDDPADEQEWDDLQPDEAQSEADESAFDRLREVSVETYTEDQTLRKSVGWALVGAGALLLFGSALVWGTATLTDADLKIGRVLAAVGGVAILVGAFLGLFGGRRKEGSWVSAAGAVVALVILFIAARRANLGLGFLIAIVAALFGFALAIVSWMDQSAGPREPAKRS